MKDHSVRRADGQTPPNGPSVLNPGGRNSRSSEIGAMDWIETSVSIITMHCSNLACQLT